jgi:hypothetical protein
MNSADCARIEETLDLLSTGRASPEEQTFAEAHLSGCESCRRLLSAARGEVDLLPDGEYEDLTRSILEITSGPACDRAQESICESLDAGMEPARSEMLSLHIAHCPACRQFAATLQSLREILPEMAEIDPGPDFSAAVIRITRKSRRARIRRFTRPVHLWNRLVNRPLFTWEAAYAGTLALALLFLNPWLPFWDFTTKAMSAVEISIPSGLSSLSSARAIPDGSELVQTARNISALVADGSSSARTSVTRWADKAENYLTRTAVPAARGFFSKARENAARLFAPGSRR